MKSDAPPATIRADRLPDGSRLWVVSGFDEVRGVLTHPHLLSDPSGLTGPDTGDPRTAGLAAMGLPDGVHHYFLNAIVDLDPPRHTRLRQLVSRAFTTRRMERLRPWITSLTDRLLHQLPTLQGADGTVDLVEHFAYPLPITVICELIGIPEPDRARWYAWSSHLMTARPDLLHAATPQLITHIHELIADRRTRPQDDLLSAMLHAPDTRTTAAMTDDEIVSMVLILVLAGHETTAHLIANGTLALLTHPDQLDALRRDPALLPGAVEELLRWCGPVPSARLRYAADDMELYGVHVRKGEAVQPLLDAANLDPRHLDRADRLDLTRPRTTHADHHIGFGHGIHFCLGAALARLEATIVFERLLTHYPDLALAAPPHTLLTAERPTGWELQHLPLRLTRTDQAR